MPVRFVICSFVFIGALMLVACETSESPVLDDASDTDSDGDTDSDSDADSDTDADSDADSDTDTDSDTDSDSDSDDTDECVETEDPEVTCDMIDNDCDGEIDNVDVDGDGICDCLAIAIFGATGYISAENFAGWLAAQGTTVSRHYLVDDIPSGGDGTFLTDGITADFLDTYHVIIIDRIRREFTTEEAAALESFVKEDGRGIITLIGYNFDGNNPEPERLRANTVLENFGLAYEGAYVQTGSGIIPTFEQSHEISEDITDVYYIGGMEMVDNGNQGTSEIFATVDNGVPGGMAHQTAGDGGRIVVWGDEWITFDTVWAGYEHVEAFWARMLFWVQPTDFCDVDLPPV